MEIRNAKLDDFIKYADLLQTTYQSAYTDDAIGLTPDCFSKEVFLSEDSQKYIESLLADTASHKTWLAVDGTELVGSATCIIRNDQEAELTGFYVHPNRQGSGIGKTLYVLVLAFSGERGLLLDTYLHNTKTINIYEKWGWKLDTSRGDKGYFTRHWPEWPDGLKAKCMYMRLNRNYTQD